MLPRAPAPAAPAAAPAPAACSRSRRLLPLPPPAPARPPQGCSRPSAAPAAARRPPLILQPATRRSRCSGPAAPRVTLRHYVAAAAPGTHGTDCDMVSQPAPLAGSLFGVSPQRPAARDNASAHALRLLLRLGGARPRIGAQLRQLRQQRQQPQLRPSAAAAAPAACFPVPCDPTPTATFRLRRVGRLAMCRGPANTKTAAMYLVSHAKPVHKGAYR